MTGRRVVLIGLVLVLAAACSTVRSFPDPVRPAVRAQDLTGIADLLAAAVPAADAPVRGVDIGPPDLPRSVVATWLSPPAGGAVDPGPAETLLDQLHSGQFLPVPGSDDLVALRAALEITPQARRSTGLDAAVARALRDWRPTSDTDALTGLLDIARFLAGLRDTPLPESWAAARQTGRRGCGSTTTLQAWPTSTARLAQMVGIRCVTGREPTSVADDAPLPAQLNRWRTLADHQLLAGTGIGTPDADTTAAELALEFALTGPGAYAGGASVPLTVVASALVAARDLGADLAPGPGNIRLARAVAASSGGMADQPGRGSVLDGVLGRITLRWATGHVAGSIPRPPVNEQRGLEVAAQSVFREASAVSPATAGVRPAPLATEAAAALGSVATESCDESTITRFRDAIGQMLAAPPVESRGLDDVESGVPAWALLGLQAAHICGGLEVGMLAARLQQSVAPPRAGDGAADRLASVWIDTELVCLTGHLAPVGTRTTQTTAPDVSRIASTSAVYGVGAVSYMRLRLDRIEQAGCGGDVATVLRSW